jgi:hypothetical protein
MCSMSLERLEREICELAAHVNAATCRWLLLVGEFDRREGWAEWGCKSCSHWLGYRCGLSPATARDHVRVAGRLAELPEIRAAFAAGELCYSQVRAVSRVATADTEQGLLNIARHATAGQLETIVRAYRGVLERELGEHDPAQRRRFVRCDHDDDGALLISARLPAEEGALVVAALQAGRDALRAGGGSAETTHIGDRDAERAPGEREAVSNADALTLMADSFLVAGSEADRTGAERYQVVVHVEAPALAGSASGACSLDDGPALPPETARRLACDASLVRIMERDGRPLSVGRRSRSVPPALRRALRSRDRACRFPNCGQRRFLHAHHLEHWARGGRTDLSNLIHLCGFHHRLVHEGGYTVEGRAGGDLRFRRPDGLEVKARPHRPRVKQGALERRHRHAGLVVTDKTCVPQVGHDRLQPTWVVDGLVDHDPRLRE